MKKSSFYSGIACFVLAAILFLLDATKFKFLASSTNVIIYPAIFFTMMGVVLVAVSLRKPVS